LLVVIGIVESTNTSQELFAYCNIHFNNLEDIGGRIVKCA